MSINGGKNDAIIKTLTHAMNRSLEYGTMSWQQARIWPMVFINPRVPNVFFFFNTFIWYFRKKFNYPGAERVSIHTKYVGKKNCFYIETKLYQRQFFISLIKFRQISWIIIHQYSGHSSIRGEKKLGKLSRSSLCEFGWTETLELVKRTERER